MAENLPPKMLAARYPTAGPDAGVIRVGHVDRPDPAPGEVLVAVAVSGVNPTDWKRRKSLQSDVRRWVIPNQDGAGVIVAVGDGVSSERIGERVWLWQAQWQRACGTAAQYCAIPTERAVALPENTSFDLAAGLGIPAMTAHRCLFADGPLGEGHRVLVQGGAGAVGHAAIQLARFAGTKVATTVDGAEKALLAAAAGADLVVDHRRQDVAARIRSWCSDGVDRVIEVDVGHNLAGDIASMRPGSTIACYTTPTDPVELPRDLLGANARLEFTLVYAMPGEAKQAAVEFITAALRDGALTALPATRFPLTETAAAHDGVENGIVGKVLIDIDPELARRAS